MKIWAISKEKGAEYEIGLECDGMDRETAMTELYRMARNLFTGEFATIHATMPEIAAQPSEMMISFIGLPQKRRGPFL